MMNAFFSILPIFILIVLGFIIKNRFIKNPSFWEGADKLVYYILFPSLLILDIGAANFSGDNMSGAISATIIATLIVAALIFFTRIFYKTKGPLFSSIFQGGIRYNSYVFISTSHALFGDTGVAISGVFASYMIVPTNVMSIIVMNNYGEGGKKSLSGMFFALTKNSLIISAFLGLFINFSDLNISGPSNQFLSYLANASTPISLMSVGAGLIFKMHSSQLLSTIFSVLLKLAALPALTIAILSMLGISGLAGKIAVLYASVPCAGNAYILSRQMGGDSETMASIITWSTLISIVSITLIMGFV